MEDSGMLFSSYVFILLFLPVVLLGFAACQNLGKRASSLWLVAASFFFYGYWDVRYVGLIVTSILVNHWLGTYLTRHRESPWRTPCLFAGLAFNLGLLGYFKYANFFVDTVSQLTGFEWSIQKIILPLGISFFTFQKVAYIVDAWKGKCREYDLDEYALFVMFFPQLIAGPIVQHHDLLGQLEKKTHLTLNRQDFSVGLTLFTFGLFKKVIIADLVSQWVSPVFDHADPGSISTLDAWLGTIAYTLQLYFDFSGYSDMGIGLGRMFSLKLPVNFNSPYKALSIADFWRRWHITLGAFLRNYIYFPLGGSRCGAVRRSLNLMATMLLGGLWHGANWTYILWGVMQGTYLCVNHSWTTFRKSRGWTWTDGVVWKGAAWCLTILAVMFGWVMFRAPSIGSGGAIWSALCGFGGGASPLVQVEEIIRTLALVSIVALFLPNSQQLLARYEPCSDWEEAKETTPSLGPIWRRFEWRPTPLRGAIVTGLLFLAMAFMTRTQEFLYFQF
jgi:alginate O-acetyltransferase complex protein AlgI